MYYTTNITTKHGDNMQLRNGDLCRVITNSGHRDPHMGDMVLITKEKLNPETIIVYYVEGYNLTKQTSFQHKVDELEKVEKKCN